MPLDHAKVAVRGTEWPMMERQSICCQDDDDLKLLELVQECDKLKILGNAIIRFYQALNKLHIHSLVFKGWLAIGLQQQAHLLRLPYTRPRHLGAQEDCSAVYPSVASQRYLNLVHLYANRTF